MEPAVGRVRPKMVTSAVWINAPGAPISRRNQMEDVDMDKLPRTASELAEEMRLRLGAGDYKVTIHESPALGWHAIIHGNRQADADRLQTQADTVAAELCQHYRLQED